MIIIGGNSEQKKTKGASKNTVATISHNEYKEWYGKTRVTS